MVAAGSRLGPYEIVSPLGSGGMGVVYRALDTRLGREVALKLLSVPLQGDPSLRSRFDREALALAALNHPHIAAIHDVVDVGDQRAIVMELVSGATLADRLAAGPLPIHEAIDYGIDISDALSAAHAAGIVHRDLKPENIVLADAGAKVLDFGVARLVTSADEVSGRTTNAALTADRAVLGTFGYMSPEQANGHAADARSDIFSLGVVLYEAVSGRRAFGGDTPAGIVSALLRDDPPSLLTLVPATPRALDRSVMRCLAKDPRRRYQSAADLRAVLEDVRDDLRTSEAGHGVETFTAGIPAAPTFARRARRASVYIAAALALVAAGMAAAGALSPSVVLTPRYRPFVTEVTAAINPAWSPDGRTLAYMDVVGGQQQIFLRSIDSPQSTRLAGDAAPGQPPIWAPDGSRIYFVRASDGSLMSVGAGGGEAQLVAATAANGAGTSRACISPDGRTIVINAATGGAAQLWTLDTRTGAKTLLHLQGLPRPLVNVQSMSFSPDGATLAIVASTTALNQSRGIWVVSWPGGSARELFGDAPYLASGFSIGWMPDNRRVVFSGTPLNGGASQLIVADTAAATLSPLTGGKDGDVSPAVSPDGRRIAFVSRRSGMDLIQFPIDGGSPEPLLASSRAESYPDMIASGLLAYITDADGYAKVRLRSAGDAWSRAIDAASDRAAPPGEVRLSPDGQRAAVGTYGSDHLIWIYPTAGGTAVRLDRESTDHHGPSWSPDGNWIAYRRLLNRKWSLVKAPLGGGAVQVLEDAEAGGGATDWSPTGEWIAHARPAGLHLVSPDGSAKRVLATGRIVAFRFSRDGSQLLIIRRGARRQWELSVWDVAAARERRVVALALAAAADVQWLTLSADGERIIVSAGMNTSDIWLLENFDPPASLFAEWFRR